MTYRLDKVPGLTVPLPTSDDGRAFLFTALDVVHDSVVLDLGNLRALVGRRLEGVTMGQLRHSQEGRLRFAIKRRRRVYIPNLELLGDLCELLGELIVDLSLDEDSGSGTACLTVVEAVGELGFPLSHADIEELTRYPEQRT